MTDSPGDPIEVYRARSLPEAHTIRILLENLGVPVSIDNEMLQGAIGDLPMGWITAPRIMIHPHSTARRRWTLRDHPTVTRPSAKAFIPASGPPWREWKRKKHSPTSRSGSLE